MKNMKFVTFNRCPECGGMNLTRPRALPTFFFALWAASAFFAGLIASAFNDVLAWILYVVGAGTVIIGVIIVRQLPRGNWCRDCGHYDV